MKKLFTLLTLALLSIGSAWATTELVYYNATGITVSGTTATMTSGLSIAQTNSKNLASGGNITIGSSAYQSFKLSTGSRNLTITAPSGNEITAITAYTFVNSETMDGGHWSVTSGTEISSKAGTAFTSKDKTAPDVQKMVFTPASSIGLSWTGNQLCVVFQIEYFSTTTAKYTLTPAANPAAGASNISAARDYYAGSTAYLKTVAADGYIFNNWKNGDDVVATTAECFVTMPAAATTLTANFTLGTSHTITGAIADGQSTWGSITNSGANVVVENEKITFVATANTGYGFVNWQKDGVDYSTDASITVTSTADATYTAFFKQLFTINFNVDAENKGTSTTGFGTQYANISDKWTASTNYYVAKEGYTLTKWNDGANDYTPGTEYTLAGNITVAPIFTANTKSLGDLTAETTVTWTFARSAGAPALASEDNTQYYVKQANVAGETIDVPILVSTVNGYGISGKKGKFNNSGNEGYAQVNNGTVFKIPAVKGMLVKYMTNQTSALSNIGFTDNTSDLGGDGTALTTPTVISGDDKTISYTYTGTADYLYLVDIKGGKYPTGLSVTYPEKQTKYIAPTITVGDFSFASKAYPVTITAAEGTLEVSTDGTNYTAQTSPYEVNVTSTTHFYAKATGVSFDPSDVVDENVVCTFDGGKKYVAWVYESNYKNSPNNYAIGSDAIHTALADIYNVVDVDIKDYNSAITDAQKTALNGNLDDADLVVISEAAAGGSKALIGLKDIVGTVPMLNMKLFAYTYNSDASKNRWGWGTPKNADKAVVAITPSSKIYKVLEGVTFNGEDIELFAYPNEQNHIQYVDSWQAEPAGDVVLATTSSKPAMHASTSQKYFALGLSCDDYTKYNANAVAIVKNAAAMLIAGEALDAKVSSVSVTIAASGYSSLASAYGLNFAGATPAGLEAYVASAITAGGVTLNAVTEAPASTGVILKGTPGETYNIPVKADAAAVGTNYLHAAVAAYNCAANEVYILKGGKFCKVTAASTVPAGKAYLLASDVPASAPELEFNFGGTTGIKSVDSGQLTVDSSEVYNLAGQRVAQPTKGLYIVNGRKVVIK